MSVKEKLDYLLETKELIRKSINNLDGNISEEADFDEYMEQIQTIIDTKVIPQSDLDNLMNLAENINGGAIDE